MKLVFAIVHNEDSHKVMEKLNKGGFGVTKLSSAGGFLRSGNATLLSVVEESNLEEVINTIKQNSQSRKQVINSSMMPGAINSMFIPYPVEVEVGGATIFVTAVERYEKA